MFLCMSLPPPIHTVFHSPDLTAASNASDVFLSQIHGIPVEQVHAMRVVCFSLAPPPSQPDAPPLSVEYRYNNICTTEFHVLTDFDVHTRGSDAVERIITEVASTRIVFSACCCHVVRFILPDYAPSAFFLLLRRMVERFGETTLFVVVCVTSMQLDPRLRSRFALVRIRGRAAARQKNEPERALYDMVAALLDQSNGMHPEKVFHAVHSMSFRLCGTLVTIDLLGKVVIDICSDRGMDDYGMRQVVCVCAEVDAMKHRIDKMSLLFDLLLMRVVPLSLRAHTSCLQDSLCSRHSKGTKTCSVRNTSRTFHWIA